MTDQNNTKTTLWQYWRNNPGSFWIMGICATLIAVSLIVEKAPIAAACFSIPVIVLIIGSILSNNEANKRKVQNFSKNGKNETQGTW